MKKNDSFNLVKRKEFALNDEDRLLFARISDRVQLCQKQGRPAFTHFLDPARATRCLEFLGKPPGLSILAFGGREDCERRMLGFGPQGQLQPEDFPISVIEIAFNAKFSRELAHREYLGSILGLGITREKVGDIYVNPSGAIVFVDSDIAGYICANLEKVSRTAVKARILEADDFAEPEQSKTQAKVNVSSMRLDAVLSSVFHLSRSKSAALISGEKALINWTVVTSASHNCKPGDVITLRGTGRVKILEVVGHTKKERLVILVEKN